MVIEDDRVDLRRAIETQDAAEAVASRAAYALAEAEERLDDEASDVTVAEVEGLRLRYAEALAAAEEARRHRREVEATLDCAEVARVYGLLYAARRR
jgi:hypothetical protein